MMQIIAITSTWRPWADNLLDLLQQLCLFCLFASCERVYTMKCSHTAVALQGVIKFRSDIFVAEYTCFVWDIPCWHVKNQHQDRPRHILMTRWDKADQNRILPLLNYGVFYPLEPATVFCFFNTKYRIDKLLVLWQPYCSPLQLPTVWAFHYMQVNSSSKITSSVSLAKNSSVQNIQQRLLILKTTNRYYQLINRWFCEQLDDGPEWILAVVWSKCCLQAGVFINFTSIIQADQRNRLDEDLRYLDQVQLVKKIRCVKVSRPHCVHFLINVAYLILLCTYRIELGYRQISIVARKIWSRHP